MKHLIRRALALCLSLTLLLSAALAVGSFEKTRPYSPFPDLAGHWAEPCVRVCVETGLMEGVGGRFAPETTLTNAEAAAIAARIREALTGEPIPAAGSPWYQVYVDYLTRAGITVKAPRAYATRQSFLSLLAAVLPDSELTAINFIRALPDTNDPAVLKFYNAGILTGTDRYGTFDGASPLTRAQCAAMAARIADPALRRRFTPDGQVPAGDYADDALVMTVDGAPVTYASFRAVLLSLTGEVLELYTDYGLSFSWGGGYGVENWNDTLRQAARHSLAAQVLVERKAAELGCAPEDLARTLFGPPTEAELDECALEQGLDRQAPGTDELLTDVILEEKLNVQLGLWVDEAEIVTTPVYETLLAEELWALYGEH